MTSTSVVLGIAALGTPEAPPDCDWATDDAGITEFIGLSFLDSVWLVQSKKSTNPTLLSLYQMVQNINLDAATYRWLQINSAGQAVPMVWYHWVPLIVAVVLYGTRSRPGEDDG